MVTPRPPGSGAIRATTAGALVLAVAASLLGGTACASVWGFDPLSQAGDAGDSSTASSDAGPDAVTLADGTSVPDGQGVPDGTNPSDGQNIPDAANDRESGASGMGPVCENTNGMCACTVMNQGNGVPCSAAALGVGASDVVCCADPTYPQGGGCTCQWIGCTNSGGTCICGPLNGQPGGSCAAGSWTCCLQTGAPECLCASISCQVGFTPFGNACGISDLKCAGAQMKVASCN